MGILSSFLNNLESNGNSTVLIKTNKENEYIVIKASLNEEGQLYVNNSTCVYDSDEFEPSEIISCVDIENADIKNIECLFSYLLSLNFSKDDGEVEIRTQESKEFYLPNELLTTINRVASRLFQISNHDIAWSLSSNDRDLNQTIQKALNIDGIGENLSLSIIEELENKLIYQVAYAIDIENMLKNGKIDLNINKKWGALYDDRKLIYTPSAK